MKIALTDAFAQEKIRANHALIQVIDPELNINIIDLGLVYGLDFTIPNRITVTMTLSTPHCPLGDAIESGVTNALGKVFPDYQVDIQLVWEPEWSIDLVSEAGKEQLGIK
ncbi:metal-sulfur cluster assembly factor [Sphingobacterium wenxiniae]|uniref:Metal-sulfur cluster biosynthetic enzyme n=1 Tax=Sphingobacterium wenxiniae TaxID=683125 RepID=A0A1I6T1X0_9SPHI|nr:metal-sulfur cluster assembly factor [Sphingobacterium wenxiniae]SFS83113.1 Metal-sulfur cluster biosynthetic enzyme [Sphingobacterium wenxiniae]